MNNATRLLLLSPFLTASLTPYTFSQEVGVFYIERGHEVYQTSATTVIPIDDQWANSEPNNYAFGAGAMVETGTLSSFKLRNTVYPDGVDIPWSEDDGYDYWTTFSTKSALDAVAPAGTYTFTGVGNTVGAFSHSIDLDAFAPQAIKKFVNFETLQNADPTKDLVIQWEPFADAGDILAFIEVEVRYWTGSYDVTVWDSIQDPRYGDFGLPPDVTSVTIPAGSLVGSPWNTYTVTLNFLRVDKTATAEKFPEAIFAGVTTLNVNTNITTRTDVPARIYLASGQWSHYGKFSWLFGLNQDWGYSFHLGFINVRNSPSLVYQSNLGWIYCIGDLEQGMWLYHPVKGWLYTPANYGGWYVDLQGNWDNMISPNP